RLPAGGGEADASRDASRKSASTSARYERRSQGRKTEAHAADHTRGRGRRERRSDPSKCRRISDSGHLAPTYDGRVVETPGMARMFVRGLLRRCPRCGYRPVFRRWVTMVDHCPGCGYRFERDEGFVLGVMAINIALTSTVFVVYLVLGFVLTWPDPPL